jgi:hypothetical protein
MPNGTTRRGERHVAPTTNEERTLIKWLPLETSFSASASPPSPRPELPGNRRTPISAIAITVAVLLAIPATASAQDFNKDCNDIAFAVDRQEALMLHGDLNRSFGYAGSIQNLVDAMVARYGGTRDDVLRQCTGTDSPETYWRDLQRQADSYVSAPAPPQPAQQQSIICDPLVPGMPIVCRPFPAR